MGAKSSTPRSVQLENDSPVSVIDVSEAVVDRLKGLHSKGSLQLLYINIITSNFIYDFRSVYVIDFDR